MSLVLAAIRRELLSLAYRTPNEVLMVSRRPTQRTIAKSLLFTSTLVGSRNLSPTVESTIGYSYQALLRAM